MSTESSMDVNVLSEHVNEGHIDHCYREEVRWVEKLKAYRDKKKGAKISEDLTKEQHTLIIFEKLAIRDSSVDIPLLVLDYKYHPCTTDLETLQKVTITDLEMETRHPDTVLIARRSGPVTQTWSRLLVHVKDEKGRFCVLTYNQHMRDVPAEEYIPEGAVLAIKQPHLHIDAVHPGSDTARRFTPFNILDGMSCVVRVDHPADLTVLSPSDDLVPSQWRTKITAESAMSMKEQGNFAFSKGHFLQAHRCYSEGIKLLAKTQSTQELAADLYRNRARTGLSLSFYDDAKSDALMSVSLLPSVDERTVELNTKALFRAATAAYRLGDFMESQTLLVQLGDLKPDDQHAIFLANKTKLRLREQTLGTYDFGKMSTRVQDRGTIDAASFICRTEVRTMPGGGTGLYATQDIQAGGLVLCEKAFAFAAPEDIKAKPAHMVNLIGQYMTVFGKHDAALWKNAVDKIARNKSTTTQLDTLDDRAYALHCGTHSRPALGAWDDSFFLNKIVIGYSECNLQAAETGLNSRPGFWPQKAHMNHSCMPNTASAFIGDLMIVRATRPIRSGEQLYSRRCSLQFDYNEMANILDTGPKGRRVCDCAICIAERQTTPAQRTARQEALKEFTDFDKSTGSLQGPANPSKAKSLMIQARKLEQKLSATYDNDTFTDVMPRRGLARLYCYMEAIRMHGLTSIVVDHRQDVGKHLKNLLKALKAQGCQVTIDSAGNVSFANLYHSDLDWTERILIQCSRVAVMTGHIGTGLQFLDLAKETHLLLNCDLAGFDR